jgi:hypothetical protein
MATDTLLCWFPKLSPKITSLSPPGVPQLSAVPPQFALAVLGAVQHPQKGHVGKLQLPLSFPQAGNGQGRISSVVAHR